MATPATRNLRPSRIGWKSPVLFEAPPPPDHAGKLAQAFHSAIPAKPVALNPYRPGIRNLVQRPGAQ